MGAGLADLAAGTDAQAHGPRSAIPTRPACAHRRCQQGTPRVRLAPSVQEWIRSAPAVVTRQTTPSPFLPHATTGDYLTGSPHSREFATNITIAEVQAIAEDGLDRIGTDTRL